MKFLFITVLLFQTLLMAQEQPSISFDDYLKSFDYQAAKDMKIKAKEMLELVSQNKAQLIDVRFKEEYEAWHLGTSKNIPLNELAKRLDELDKSKLIITACSRNDRANMARLYLQLKGYNVKYLSDGLLSVEAYLKGANAKNYILNSKKGTK